MKTTIILLCFFVSCASVSCKSSHRGIAADPNASADVNLQVWTAVVRSTLIEGVVVYQNGAAASGVEVRLDTGHGYYSLRSDADGKCSLGPTLIAESYRLCVVAGGQCNWVSFTNPAEVTLRLP